MALWFSLSTQALTLTKFAERPNPNEFPQSIITDNKVLSLVIIFLHCREQQIKFTYELN
jgi:hypothetical protein